MNLAVLEARIAVLEARIAVLEAQSKSGPTASGAVADDRELDSKYGNPTVRKDPKRWLDDGGKSYAGMPFSHCPPEYLETLASLLDWKADRDDEKGTEDGKKYARYARIDAARARGWAARIRAGKVTPKPVQTPSAFDAAADFGDDSDLPF